MNSFLNKIFNEKDTNISNYRQVWLNFINLAKNNNLHGYDFGVIIPDIETSMPESVSICRKIETSSNSDNINQIIKTLENEGFIKLGKNKNSFFMKNEIFLSEIYSNDSLITVTFYIKDRGSYYDDYSDKKYT